MGLPFILSFLQNSRKLFQNLILPWLVILSETKNLVFIPNCTQKAILEVRLSLAQAKACGYR